MISFRADAITLRIIPITRSSGKFAYLYLSRHKTNHRTRNTTHPQPLRSLVPSTSLEREEKKNRRNGRRALNRRALREITSARWRGSILNTISLLAIGKL